MKTTYFLLTLTLAILGSAAKAQHISQGNIHLTTNSYVGKGSYPNGVLRDKAKAATTVPQKNTQVTKLQNLTTQVTEKPALSRASMIGRREYGGLRPMGVLPLMVAENSSNRSSAEFKKAKLGAVKS